jgi:Na+(H+)/acetate symporter ActP
VHEQADFFFTVGAMVAIAAVTMVTGLYGTRTRSTSNFLVASRTVGPRWNAAAICGEFLSAASFLGIAGLVLKGGVDALWYPIGFTAGYLALLLFVAAPLRRSGAYTLPDFAEERLGSALLRKVCTGFVIVIGWLYLVPQLQGAGLTIAIVSNSKYPQWVGAAGVMVIVTFNIYTGWMRSITVVQAFQYWIKLTALAVPVFVLLIHHAAEDKGSRASLGASASPSFAEATHVRLDHDVVVQVKEPMQLKVSIDGRPVPETELWSPGEHHVPKGTTLHFDANSRMPVISGAVIDNDTWLRPFSSPVPSPLLATYSLVLALMLGTMGLPHVLGRYYTNPDGLAARKTTLVVLALLGVFYLFPVISGWLARLYVPQLLVSGNTDAALLLLPLAALGGWPAQLLGGLIAAGAFAAFVSAASGLVISQRRPARPAPELPGGHLGGLVGPAGLHACRVIAGPGPGCGAGLRGGRFIVLPAAGAGHLVARADRRRRGSRPAGRRRVGRRRGADRRGRRAPARMATGAGPASGVHRAAGVPDHGRGEPPDKRSDPDRRDAHPAAAACTGPARVGGGSGHRPFRDGSYPAEATRRSAPPVTARTVQRCAHDRRLGWPWPRHT